MSEAMGQRPTGPDRDGRNGADGVMETEGPRERLGRNGERRDTAGKIGWAGRVDTGVRGMDHAEIVAWLRETDPGKIESLRNTADELRQRHCGQNVWLRGLIEISNTCSRNCLYCGVRNANRNLVRYRLNDDEILDCARMAAAFGYGTVVLQSGEDPGVDAERMDSIIRMIRNIPTAWGTPLAVTLSLGERTEEELALWKK
ncbi:MAG: hypothetical protein Q4C47_02085, partial [Planctomycetia bacterium]|nr:hypothetical protein [Planctomycetia bacterium]